MDYSDVVFANIGKVNTEKEAYESGYNKGFSIARSGSMVQGGLKWNNLLQVYKGLFLKSDSELTPNEKKVKSYVSGFGDGYSDKVDEKPNRFTTNISASTSSSTSSDEDPKNVDGGRKRRKNRKTRKQKKHSKKSRKHRK